MSTWVWVFIPIVGMCVAIVAIYTEHRQKMAMIEKGIKPEESHRTKGPNRTAMVIGGLVLIGMGFAFLVAQLLGGLDKRLYVPSFFFLFVGIALVVGYYLTRKPGEQPAKK